MSIAQILSLAVVLLATQSTATPFAAKGAPAGGNLTAVAAPAAKAAAAPAVKAANTPQLAANGTQLSANTTQVKAAAAVTASNATALNATAMDCSITVPADPLSAQGLATPYLLQPPCAMAVASQQAFVEAAIIDPVTGAVSIYHPIVTTAGVAPAAAPIVPQLPANAVVSLFFGFNGGVLKQVDANGQDANNSPSLKAANCVNGLTGVQDDLFGQVSFCNAPNWFQAANAAIAAGLLVLPPLGKDNNGNDCPTTRSFAIVDADPNDNVATIYKLTADGAIAQATAANKDIGEEVTNGSDEALVALILDPLIGCQPFTAPSLDDPGAKVPALVLSELHAAAFQAAPISLVELNDPETVLTSNGDTSVAKTNLYRINVNQPPISPGVGDGSLDPYCTNTLAVAPAFIQGFQTTFLNATSPDTSVGNNLFTFMCNRVLQTLSGLTCPPPPVQPITCKLDGDCVATSCTINLNAKAAPAAAAGTKATTNTGTKANLAVNGAGTGNGGAAQAAAVSSSTSIAAAAASPIAAAAVAPVAAAAASPIAAAAVAPVAAAAAAPIAAAAAAPMISPSPTSLAATAQATGAKLAVAQAQDGSVWHKVADGFIPIDISSCLIIIEE